MVDSPKKPKRRYATNVFVNCPFDEQYKPLFRALVFVIEYCGFSTRCALEVEDSGETRAEKLIRIIKQSQFGIHDISRTESNAEGLPRFNMPYEFGIFTGFKYSGHPAQRRKALLVLDTVPYRYQKFLSDIAGQDIKAHRGNPETLIRVVRAWLQNQTQRELVGGDRVVSQFRLFQSETPQLLAVMNKTELDLENYLDFYRLVHSWIADSVSSE